MLHQWHDLGSWHARHVSFSSELGRWDRRCDSRRCCELQRYHRGEPLTTGTPVSSILVLHRYLDDTPTDSIDIALRVAEMTWTGNFAGTNGVDFTLVGERSLLNVAPSLGPISVLTSRITEGGIANASVTITDPGTLDVFARNVNGARGRLTRLPDWASRTRAASSGDTYVWIARRAC